MEKFKILSMVDHTLLKQTSTWEEIRKVCDEAIKYNVASVCIPASYVKKVKEYVRDNMRICTVIGFPNGYSTTDTKVFETQDAIINGADEIDMVVNIGNIKDGKYDDIIEEINKIKDACDYRILKVIIETCLLTEEEKKRMCNIVSVSKADYIKTSTGFSIGGATIEDIKLFKQNISNGKKIKAAGGISSFEDAENFILAGAERLGTSRLIKIMEENNV